MNRLLIIALVLATLASGDTLVIQGEYLIDEKDFRESEDFIIRSIYQFQNDPLSPGADSILNTLFEWVDKVPYIELCPGTYYMPGFYLKRNEYPYYVRMFWGFTYGQLLYILEHRGRYREEEMILSGFEAMFRVYRSLKTVKHDARSMYFDRFEEIHKRGMMGAFIEKRTAQLYRSP